MSLSLKEQVKTRLGVLQRKKLWACGRTLEVQWFQFGPFRRVTSPTGRLKEVGEYALHVMSAWRVTGSSGLVVASGDRYFPRQDSEGANDDFDWRSPGTSRCDSLVEAFVEQELPVLVESFTTDDYGGFRLGFERGFGLEVFPDHSTESEHWRILQPGTDAPHFVLRGHRFGEE